MNFKGLAIGLLTTLLLITATGSVITAVEAKKQTEIALRTAEMISIQVDTIVMDTDADPAIYFWRNNEIERIRLSLGLGLFETLN